MKIILILAVMFSFQAHSQILAPREPYKTESFYVPSTESQTLEGSPVEETALQVQEMEEPVPEPEIIKTKEKRTSATNREDSFGSLMLGYQILNTWVPAKKTLSFAYYFNRDWGLELEYATSKFSLDIAGINLGRIEEDRYSLLGKYFVGNSFYFNFGGYVSKLELFVGDKFGDAAGNQINDSFIMDIYGASFGVGNRWIFDNGITLGVDWLRFNMPIATSTKQRILKELDEENSDDVKSVAKIFKNFPAFTFVGVNLGYTF